ncbi:transposase [Vreelandella glaciei]|uniref:transposase n=1 Tax=Vreelandella glaciei TaxID=186761 RepID=UPI003C6F0AC3|tara:strand:+ start:672 stop:1082 length:411 start_codon:yes stop_codon:yes gene_type:complete
MLNAVAQQVLPYLLPPDTTSLWIIDDTSIRKKGRHSVGVSHQYCGEIGKQDNCQVADSLSMAIEQASLPVAWRLYLQHHGQTIGRAGVPEKIDFATKPEIALQQVRETLDTNITPGIVLADAAYSKVTPWREQLAE